MASVRAQSEVASLPPSTELGALIAEVRRGSPAIGWVAVSLAIALALYSVYRAVASDWVWLALSGLWVPVLGFGAWGLRHRIRIFEHGVEVWAFFSRRALRYAEAEHLSFRLVEVRVHGVPTGLHIQLTLRGGRKTLTYLTRANVDVREHLEGVRDRAARAIARSAWERMLRGEPFAWGGTRQNVQLRNDGLVYRKKRLLFYGDPVVLPYSAELNYAIAEGYFALATKGNVVLTLSCDSDNFYPGLLLYESLVGSAREAGTV